MGTARPQAPGSELVLHTFASVDPAGSTPYAGVILDSAGNLYGTTLDGGTANAGVVYKLDPAGKVTFLYSFTGGTDGATPTAGVIRDADGNLYGVAAGGTGPCLFGGCGIVYKLNTAGQQTVLYSFTGGADGGNNGGGNLEAGVIRDSAGNLYGTTVEGGTADAGVVYKLDTSGQQSVLYTFTGLADGGSPMAGVIRDSEGNLYGTTYHGGTNDTGVVYKVDVTGHETVLYSFTGNGGANPFAGVIRDSSGNLYGTTYGGGTAGHGVVYKLDAASNETVLYSFTGGVDGGSPFAGVIRDSAGNLYGTTSSGGTAGYGVVYKVDAVGNETVLHSFAGGTDGAYTYVGVTRDLAGNLYGTTQSGGTGGIGVVYKLDATGKETVLRSFTVSRDGRYPSAGVVRGSVGKLYGTTGSGGTGGGGIVYELDATGKETVLYSFTGGADGGSPDAGVIGDSAGNLFGTTSAGGITAVPCGSYPYRGGCGVVYKLDAAGHATVLYSFTGGADGGQPQGGVIRDSAGNLYGTTYYGGIYNDGVVYKVDATGHETVLHSFRGASDGCGPMGGVIRDSAGNLYGTASACGNYPFGEGVVYKLDATGHETVLYRFTGSGGVHGATPEAGVIRDSAGNLYGTTYKGGAAGYGVVYKLDPAGHETVLYSFTGLGNGAYPTAGVIRDPAGNLYGTTSYGGITTGPCNAYPYFFGGCGVVYKLDATGQESLLYTFTGGTDGGYPYAGVIRDSAGNLYGTTEYGGAAHTGVVFELPGAATAQ